MFGEDRRHLQAGVQHQPRFLSGLGVKPLLSGSFLGGMDEPCPLLLAVRSAISFWIASRARFLAFLFISKIIQLYSPSASAAAISAASSPVPAPGATETRRSA